MKYRFERNVDRDGWFKLPREMRDEYGDGYIGMGFAVYLHLMTVGAWQMFEKSISAGRPSMPTLLDEEMADLADRLIVGLVRLRADDNGRVKIPAELRRAAKIDDKIVGVFVGTYWRIYALSEFNNNHTIIIDPQQITE